MLHAYWGDGKGKTCAAMGLAMRAAAAGWRIVVVQFLKDGSSSEISLLRKLPGVEAVLHDGALAKFTFRMSDEEKAASRALHDDNLRCALGLACRAAEDAAAREGCLLVLDEALDALRAGLLDEGLLRDALGWAAGTPPLPARRRGSRGHRVLRGRRRIRARALRVPFCARQFYG